ncbi:protein takeout-like isoform X2 [Nilaparvata lugens]|uniref:protein takeout-like isoform X2 n=1 Tax=Nilaparvata lugens TaxID=108931 RepID=UPI00193CF8FD|nr:protein takeout-like isoform X2 [Nilaparvata lugens]
MASENCFSACRMLAIFLCLSSSFLEFSSAAPSKKIPDYIKICKRNDPKLDECILHSVEDLRPKLIIGIPELEIPAIEPLILPEVVVSPGGSFKAVGKDVTVHGAGNYKVKKLTTDLKNLVFSLVVAIPSLHFEGKYDVNATVLGVPIQGKGPMKANATDVTADLVLKGKASKRGGSNYIDFYNIELGIDLGNYDIKLENLFNGDKALGDAVNIAINENKQEFMKSLKPVAERVAAEMVLTIANKISRKFPFDTVFPEN